MISFFSQIGKATNSADTSAASGKTMGNEAGSFLVALQGSLQSAEAQGQGTANTSATPLMFTFLNGDQEVAASEEASLVMGDEAELTLETESVIEDLLSIFDQDEEQSSEESEEFIADLKGWLQQALYYLYPVNDTENEGQSASLQTINTLSENSETVRYALQEVLHQLVEVSKTNVDAAVIEEPIHTQQLIASLKEIFQKSDLNTESVTKLNSLMAELSRVAESKQTTGSVEFPEMQLQAVSSTSEDLQNVVVEEKTNKIATKEMIQTATQDEPAEQPETTLATQTATNDEGIESQGTTPITAGQLAIKNGTAPLTKSENVMPVQHFAKDMSELVVSKFEFVKQHGMSEAVISLRPQHLGQLDVQLTMQNGHLVARFMTEHAGAKELLEQQMTQLRAVLQAQGIQVERLEVTQNTSLSSHMYQGGGSSNGQPGNQRRSKEREVKNEDALRTVEIQDELRTWMQEQQELELYTGTEQTNGFTAKV